MYRVTNVELTDEVRSKALELIRSFDDTMTPLEIVYVANETRLADGEWMNTNVCFRVKNHRKGRGEPETLTHLVKSGVTCIK